MVVSVDNVLKEDFTPLRCGFNTGHEGLSLLRRTPLERPVYGAKVGGDDGDLFL